LGLSQKPAPGTVWKMGVAIKNRNDAADTPLPDQKWPDQSFAETNPVSWGGLRFDIPRIVPLAAVLTQTISIRNGVNGANVKDVDVGSHTGGGVDPAGFVSCTGPSEGVGYLWDTWGNYPGNYTIPSPWKDNYYGGYWANDIVRNVQNEADSHFDFFCNSKTYYSFPITSIPKGKVITSAKLYLKHTGNSVNETQPLTTPSEYIVVYSVDATHQITVNQGASCVIRAMPITESGASRSPNPAHGDHPIRAMPITGQA
jgi:hypothetical protein